MMAYQHGLHRDALGAVEDQLVVPDFLLVGLEPFAETDVRRGVLELAYKPEEGAGRARQRPKAHHSRQDPTEDGDVSALPPVFLKRTHQVVEPPYPDSDHHHLGDQFQDPAEPST